ncbi:MAG: hypothetical protein ABI423_04835 [Burkholderiales bacterium]
MILVMVVGFASLILMSVKAYHNAPPIPAKAITSGAEIVYTADEVSSGQAVFLKYGLMNNGTIWGHGGMLGPDFSAQTLHNLALFDAERTARERFGSAYDELDSRQRGTVDGEVAAKFKANRYDPASGTLTLLPEGKAAFDSQVAYWTDYFLDPARNGGLAKGSVSDPKELRELTAFFVWTAWAAAAERPGTRHSYTNNFPYDPLVGNHPTGATVLWSAISLLFLLGGIGIVLLAFGKFDYLGWHGVPPPAVPSPVAAGATRISPAQADRHRASLVLHRPDAVRHGARGHVLGP